MTYSQRFQRTPRKRISQIELRTRALHMLVTMTDERFDRRDEVLTSLTRSYGLHPSEAAALWDQQSLSRQIRRG